MVGVIAPPFELRADANEVDEIFEVPLGFLLDPRNHERQTREFQGRKATFYVMQYDQRRIWGATAGMLVNLYRRISAGPPGA